MHIDSDRRYAFAVGRASVWGALTRVEDYQRWWPWLREFDGTVFAANERWRCVLKPRWRYKVRFEVILTEVVERGFVQAQLEGDIIGWARLSVEDRDCGCEVRLISRLIAAGGAPRLMARLAQPVASLGHNWVLDSGARNFRTAMLHSTRDGVSPRAETPGAFEDLRGPRRDPVEVRFDELSGEELIGGLEP